MPVQSLLQFAVCISHFADECAGYLRFAQASDRFAPIDRELRLIWSASA